MKNYLVSFSDLFEAERVEDVYQQLLDYLEEVITYEDVTAFEIKEI